MNLPHAVSINTVGVTSGEGLMDSSAVPYQSEGIPFFPACDLMAGTALKPSDGSCLVHMQMAATSPIGNSLGLFVRFTPEGARLFAEKLIENARKVEAQVAEQAAAAIEAARQKGGAA